MRMTPAGRPVTNAEHTDTRRAIARHVIRAHVARQYVDAIGYDPFADDPAMTTEDAIAILEEFQAERAAADARAARPDTWTIGLPDRMTA